MALLSPAGIGVKTNGRSAWLDAPAAQSYRRMLAAGCPAGGITDAGRTNAEQWDLYRRYLAGKLKATAAYPGTSKHETGRALDLDDDGPNPRAWVRAHGAAFGWMRDRVKNEPWHMEYEADKDQHATTPAQEDDLNDDERAQLAAINENAAEARKYLGIMEGRIVTALGEVRDVLAALTPLVAAINENAAASRAYLGPMEQRIIAADRVEPDGALDPSAVADELARRLAK